MREFDAGIDWVHEGKKDTLPLDYACKLLHWKDAYSWPEISHLTHSRPEWKKTYSVAVASINAKTLWHILVRGKPWVRRREFFLEWAPAKGFTIPPEFARDSHCSQELNPKSLQSLLKMVIAMAIEGYGFKPEDTKSPIPGEIARDVQKAGLSIDSDTVRRWLRQAAELLRSEQDST